MHLHVESPGETIAAVVVGAVLATLGGFAATQLEALVHRRERERSAALLFGEILSALDTIITIAGASRLRGDPYGSVTLRLVRAALRETETYERNRASLYDLKKAELRIRIHVLMVQISLALEGVSEASERAAKSQSALETLGPEDARVEGEKQKLEGLTKEREAAFGYTMTTAGEIKALVAALQPLAKVNFEDLKQFSGNPYDD